MRRLGCGWAAALLAAWLVAGVAGAFAQRVRRGGCRSASVELLVREGQSARTRVTGTLDAALDPVPAGWALRVLPHTGPQPEVDFAAIATPPYHSVSPLVLSMDFAFRAQDAVGWNPRRFRYVPDRQALQAIEPVYRSITATVHPVRADELRLGQLVARMPEGTLRILDAELTPGTGDQSRAAAAVASHLETTAHRVVAANDGRATPLGRIAALRVRVELVLAAGAAAAPGVRAAPAACGAP